MSFRNLLSAYQKHPAFATSTIDARGCPGTGGVGATRGYPGTGGVGGRKCKVEKSGTRVSHAWSERQDQILRNIVDPYRGNIIPWKLLAKTLTVHIPGKLLVAVKNRWNSLK